MAFLFSTLYSRYLLIQLDGSPDMDPETLPEDDDEGTMLEIDEIEYQPARRSSNQSSVLILIF